jgi:predicted transcriptional regulator of viral defense system
MKSYTKIDKIKFIEEFKKQGIVFFNSFDVKKIFDIKDDNSLNHLLVRLNKAKIIKRLVKNKYQFLYAEKMPSDFSIANFLEPFSYVSLESALSFYGLIDQFPYRITSISLKKSRQTKVENKIFIYSKIKKDYFKDFIKIDDFLIAKKEKAVFDYIYFVYKGLRSKTVLDDMKNIFSDKKIKNYLVENADKNFYGFLNRYVKL